MLLILIIPFNSAGQASEPDTYEIKIRNYAFVPNELSVNIGDSVVFIWEDGAFGHNVEQVANSKELNHKSGFRSGDPDNGPAQWSLPSSYLQSNVTLYYICGPHVSSHNMRGKIIVGAGSPEGEVEGGNLGLILLILGGSGLVTIVAIVVLQRNRKPLEK